MAGKPRITGRVKNPAREIARAADDIRRGRFTMLKLVALIIAVILAAGLWQLTPGHVTDVTDGDTITVYTKEREYKKIRLYGVDAPESDQAWGLEAKDFVFDLVFLKEVDLSVVDTDRYGREVALVRLPDGRILNEELVRHGHAWVYREYCREFFCDDWADLETLARRGKRGLWAEGGAVAPWQWRKQKRLGAW